MTTRMPFRGARLAPAALACAWAGALLTGLVASLPATGADPDVAAPPVSWLGSSWPSRSPGVGGTSRPWAPRQRKSPAHYRRKTARS